MVQVLFNSASGNISLGANKSGKKRRGEKLTVKPCCTTDRDSNGVPQGTPSKVSYEIGRRFVAEVRVGEATQTNSKKFGELPLLKIAGQAINWGQGQGDENLPKVEVIYDLESDGKTKMVELTRETLSQIYVESWELNWGGISDDGEWQTEVFEKLVVAGFKSTTSDVQSGKTTSAQLGRQNRARVASAPSGNRRRPKRASN